MKVTICGRTDEEMKEKISRECVLREHTLSEAVDHILNLGLPLYLKEHPVSLKRIKKATQEEAAA